VIGYKTPLLRLVIRPHRACHVNILWRLSRVLKSALVARFLCGTLQFDADALHHISDLSIQPGRNNRMTINEIDGILDG